MTSFTTKKGFFDSTLHQNRIHFLHVPIVPREYKLWDFQLKITRRQSKYLFVIQWTKFGTYLHISDYFADLKSRNILTQSGNDCFVDPIFRFCFFVTFGKKVMKIQKYCVFFVYILQGKMVKTEKNRKENHITKMNKVPQTKGRKYGMNET